MQEFLLILWVKFESLFTFFVYFNFFKMNVIPSLEFLYIGEGRRGQKECGCRRFSTRSFLYLSKMNI
jgi:hypothetical protein